MFSTCKMPYVLAATLLLSIKLVGQTLTPRHFDFYDSTDKTLIFGDDFDNAKDNAWTNACNCRKVTSVESEGYFYFTNNYRNGFYRTAAAKNINIAPNEDFEIEFRAKIPFEYPTGFGTLYWGRASDSESYYMHFLFQNSRVVIAAINFRDDSMKVYTYRNKAVIKNAEFNLYTIRKTGYRYFVFINKAFVGVFPFTQLNGSEIGLGGSPHNDVIYDYIKISYLNKKKPYLIAPEYMEGENGIYKYLKILYYPKAARDQCMHGKFLVKLHVTLDGAVDSIVSYSCYDTLNKLMLETFSPMPGKWYPAIKNGNKTAGWFVIPMHLRTCPDDKQISAKSHYNAALDAQNANNIETAIEQFKIAAGMDYTDVNSLYNIAGIYLNEGKESEARYWLQRINELRDFDIPELEGIDAKITALGADELIKRYCSQ